LSLDLRFVDRVIKTTLIVTAILFPFLAFYIKMNFAVSVASGAVWGCLNLFLLRLIILNLITNEKRNLIFALTILFIKLPVLYGIGYLLMTIKYFSVGGLLWGFSGLLLIIILKVLGRMYLGMDNKGFTPEGSKV